MSQQHLKLETMAIGTFGCNCTIISSKVTKEAIIIDPGNDAATLMKKITAENYQVKYLLHTHAHFDHIGQSKIIKEKTGASMHLHQDDQFLYDMLQTQGQWFGMRLDTPGKIDSHLQDGEEFSLSDPELKKFLKTMHTPGHTPGSCCFYLEQSDGPVLFSGDTLFSNSIGRTDLPGGDYSVIVKSIKDRLFTLPEETRVVTGHGPDTTLHHEKNHNPFVGKKF